MGSRQQAGRGAAGNNNVRQNEYFVPRDGIDREVITADICRYLGNDALVRPGTYLDEGSGRNIQGYYITAYRNLTTAMIADLKQDSARWEQERRKLQSTGGSTGRYADSAARQMGASYGQTPGGYQQPSPRDYGAGDMQYPGNHADGYSAGQTGGGQFAPGLGYPQAASYAPQHQQYQPQYPSQVTDPRYSNTGAGHTNIPGYGAVSESQWAPPVPYGIVQSAQPGQTRSTADYSMDTTMGDAPPMPSARGQAPYTASQARTSYTSQAPGYTYQTPVAGGGAVGYQQPVDPSYGRGGYPATTSAPQAFSDSVASPAAGPGYYQAAVPEQPQYEEPMAAAPRTAPTVGSPAQVPSATNRRGDRGERERGDRDRDSHDRPRERERERDRDHRQDRGEDGHRRKATNHYSRS